MSPGSAASSPCASPSSRSACRSRASPPRAPARSRPAREQREGQRGRRGQAVRCSAQGDALDREAPRHLPKHAQQAEVG
eukprot:scaffold8437_cov99-Isochrysis_galbana.AAC.5